MVYILGLEKYRPLVRATVLYALLAYMFYAGALLLDLGRPWKVINPIIGNSFGISSVLFLVAWHFILYMGSLFIEFFPTVTEWATLKRQRKTFASMTLAVVIFGIALSTLHQSGLGALFLMAESKIHPLWYTEFIPVLFFVSSIFSGLSMVIVEGSISHKVFAARLGKAQHGGHDNILIGLGKICAGAMFVYLFLKVLVVIHGQQYAMLGTKWGLWFLVEVVGFVLFPLFLYFKAVREGNVKLIKVAASLTLVGILLNRLNISVIAFNWFDPTPYIPHIAEIWVTVTVVLLEIWALRWVVMRMPVLSDSPDWAADMDDH